MTPSDLEKRQFVSNLYSNRKWRRRVEKMPDHQVAKIYLDHQPPPPREIPLHEEEAPHLELPVKPLSAIHGPHYNEDDFPTY